MALAVRERELARLTQWRNTLADVQGPWENQLRDGEKVAVDS